MRKFHLGCMGTSEAGQPWATRQRRRCAMRLGGEVRARYRIAPASGLAALPGEPNSLTVASSEVLCDDVRCTGGEERFSSADDSTPASLGTERGGGCSEQDRRGSRRRRSRRLPVDMENRRPGAAARRSRHKPVENADEPARRRSAGRPASRGDRSPAQGKPVGSAGNCVTAVDRARSRPMWGRAGSRASAHRDASLQCLEVARESGSARAGGSRGSGDIHRRSGPGDADGQTRPHSCDDCRSARSHRDRGRSGQVLRGR